ncbi:class F sortase [Streptomyces sp. WMMB 322]|uniref:class F sortase n=1 Tax=Streptomyces sp. WMMB 322 TaxID=1286821 RepID=UPI0020C75F92|nr:class F sortase [Streptomyces sp. WMMB 322]
MVALLTCLTALLLTLMPVQAPSEFGPAVGGPATGHSPGPGAGHRGAPGPDRRVVPERLTLPRLAVHADVVPVGTTAAGNVAVPGDAGKVGWYRFGAAPGSAAGSAVLVGHVDSRRGERGILASLSSVRQGDAVVVAGRGGRKARYAVVSRRSVDKDAFPGQIFRRTGRPALVLVTCAAPFDPERGGYQRLLLVTAVPAGRG